MAKCINFRQVELNWRIDEQWVVFLNCTPNSILVSVNRLEVTNAHFDNTTVINDAAEAHHGYLIGLTSQSEEALQQA